MAPLGAFGYSTARWVWFVFSHGCRCWRPGWSTDYLGRVLLAGLFGGTGVGRGRVAGEALGLDIGPQLALLWPSHIPTAGWSQGASLGLGML